MYTNPYQAVNWDNCYKTNLHMHAGTGAGTCGAYPIDAVLEAYQAAGYRILMFSNHDVWVGPTAAEKYNVTLINGFEYSQDRHLLCAYTDRVFRGSPQEVIDQCNANGGFSIICHPEWVTDLKNPGKKHWPAELLKTLHGYSGIELYNPLIFTLAGNGLAETVWDQLLSAGLRIWGFANDDFHRWQHLAKGWNMVYCNCDSAESVKEALMKGSFYATNGIKLETLEFDKTTLTVSASAGGGVIRAFHYEFIGKDGRILAEHQSVPATNLASYHWDGSEMYVRVKITAAHGAMLWTQPIFNDQYCLTKTPSSWNP
jgi:hypothetical protein